MYQTDTGKLPMSFSSMPLTHSITQEGWPKSKPSLWFENLHSFLTEDQISFPAVTPYCNPYVTYHGSAEQFGN